MRIEHKKINFEDSRGTIADIFVHNPKDNITIIFSKKGAVRGNHYHKQSTQYLFMISGKMTILTQKFGENAITKSILQPYDLMTHEPYEIHTFIAEEDTVFLAFADGLRGGEDYEKDTYRVEKPLNA